MEKFDGINSCPYCGGKNLEISVDVRVACHLNTENGQIELDDGYYDSYGSELAEAIDGSDFGEDAGAYCPDCEHYSNVAEVGDGYFRFAKIPKGEARDIDKKYIALREKRDSNGK